MDTYDFIIIGGGIAGASAGFELAAHGNVLLIEREPQFGYHSTGRSAAVFLKSHGPAVIRALAAASKSFFLDPPDGFADYPLLKPRGMMLIGGHGDAEELDRIATENACFVLGTRRLSAAEGLRMVPVLREDYLGGAVYDPEATDIDVHAVHYGFLRGLRSRGARSLPSAELTGLERAHDCWTVTTTAGDFAARVIINAAGAWCDRVAGLAQASPVGLVPKRRTAFVFDAPPGIEIEQWPVVHELHESFYFKPDAGKVLASPADETPMEPCDVHPEDVDIATAIDRIQRCARLTVAHINRKWAGLRSFVCDGCPVVGYDPQVEGFFWLAGQGGYGIETSPAMGRLSASLADGTGVPEDLKQLGVTEAALSPARFTVSR
jgi:D-arginine dehydrogenase